MKRPQIAAGWQPPGWPLLDGYRLRPLRLGDEVAWYAYLAAPEVVEHTSFPALDLAAVRGMVERQVAAQTAALACRWAIVDAADVLVGTCGFASWSLVHAHAELVYDLHPRLWGRGLARAAVRRVVDWAFATGFHRVHAVAMTTNASSIRVLEACGFAREGQLRHYRSARGAPRDFYMYALLR